MNNRKPLKTDPFNFFRDIIAAKTGARAVTLQSLEVRVRNRYSGMALAFKPKELATFGTRKWDATQKEALLHCYESAVSSLVSLKNSIREVQPLALQNECPYCGIGTPGGFDHYLPKSSYPELSVHALNLIPSCGKCNEKKGERWLDGDQRIFIHFYLDSLPSTPFITAAVKWMDYKGSKIPSVSFSLKRPLHFGIAKFRIIESHFEQLELLKRYKDEAHSEYISLRDSAIARKAKSKKTLANFLNDYIETRENSIGAGNWKIALFRSIVSSPEFLDDVF